MRRKKKNRKHVNANKTTLDGIKFQSGLEVYTYRALKKAKLFEKYEEEQFEILEGFTYEQDIYCHQANNKGDFINRGNKKVLGIKYTPDFTGKTFIIECKGRPNESFPLRFKLFKAWLIANGDKRTVYVPKNQRDVDEMIEIIKSRL